MRDKESNPFGVRFKGTKLPWKVVTPSDKKGKPPDVVWKEHWCTKQQEDYDLIVVDLFTQAMYALHTTYEYDFTPADSEADRMVSRKKAELEKYDINFP